MSIDARLRDKLTPLVPAVAPHQYKGNVLEYITWNYSTHPALHAESQPHSLRNFVQVHWYLPHGANPNDKKLLIAKAIFDTGCTWPSIVDASDDAGQHYVFECEGLHDGKL